MKTFWTTFNELHIAIILCLLYILVYLLSLNRTKKLEARIGKYCAYNRKRPLIINYVYCFYKGLIRSISLFLMKLPLFSVYIEQYRKYITKENRNHVIPADYISNKILVSFIFFLIITSVKEIDGSIITDVEIIIFVLLGYIIPDIYNMIKYNNRKNK